MDYSTGLQYSRLYLKFYVLDESITRIIRNIFECVIVSSCRAVGIYSLTIRTNSKQSYVVCFRCLADTPLWFKAAHVDSTIFSSNHPVLLGIFELASVCQADYSYLDTMKVEVEVEVIEAEDLKISQGRKVLCDQQVVIQAMARNIVRLDTAVFIKPFFVKFELEISSKKLVIYAQVW